MELHTIVIWYLVKISKALIDNVYPGTSAQLWGRVKDAFQQEGREFKIDVIIQNHIENDHSGSLPEFVKKFPDVEVYCSEMVRTD